MNVPAQRHMKTTEGVKVQINSASVHLMFRIGGQEHQEVFRFSIFVQQDLKRLKVGEFFVIPPFGLWHCMKRVLSN